MSRRIEIIDLVEGDEPFDGVEVVLDVIRAFTTAAAAFRAGAERIVCVESVDRALRLGAELGVPVMGEEHGMPAAGFTYGNSGSVLDQLDLSGQAIVQRTSNGTRGLLWSGASAIYAASAAVARATVDHIDRHHRSAPIRFVCTHPAGEDRATAEYMADLLHGRQVDSAALSSAITDAGQYYLERLATRESAQRVAEYADDIAYCAAVDTYDRAIVGERVGETVVLRAATVGGNAVG